MGACFWLLVAWAADQKTFKKNYMLLNVFSVLVGLAGLLEASWELLWAMLARTEGPRGLLGASGTKNKKNVFLLCF